MALQRALASTAAAVTAALAAWLPARAADADAFELELFKTRFAQEVRFRAAAIHVAWGAEALCDNVTEIEPFVLWSVHALRTRLSARQLEILHRATGMDGQWRVVWMDESVPDALELGDAVVAIDDQPLPAASTRLEPGALFSGGALVSNDDQGFWDVLLKAREQAAEGTPMVLTLADGRKLEVPTQTGCAGSVTASAFDDAPDQFWRQGSERARIPSNAMLAARTRDEFRWLAAFGTYFQASETAIGNARAAEDRSNGFLVGKILSMAVPGAGMLLSVVEAQTERTLAVDSVVGRADLFADEVVAALGGDPAAGLQLNQRMAAAGLHVEAVQMSDFRRSNTTEHVRRLNAIRSAQEKAEAAAERAERQAQEAALRQPLVIR